MSKSLAGRAVAGATAAVICLGMTAVPAHAAVAPCYPTVGCNPVVQVRPGLIAIFDLTINNLVPGTTATATWVANGRTITASAVVGPDGIATIPLSELDGGRTTTVTVTGTTTGPNGNNVPVTRTVDVTVGLAPCTPATACDPGVVVNPPTGSGPGTVYSVTVDNMVPGSVVTVTWVADGKTQTATAVVGPDGKAVITLPVLNAGVPTPFTVTGFTSGANGQPVPVTRTGSVTAASPTPTPTTPPPTTPPPTTTPTPTPPPTTPPPPGPSLFAKATAVSKLSKMKTWISGDPAAGRNLAALAVCRGPFKFRIQKQKITTIPNGSDEPTIRVTWTTLSGKYTTNKKSGIWYYRIVNLKKGTYRSVVAPKCGLAGVTTNTVTLKK